MVRLLATCQPGSSKRLTWSLQGSSQLSHASGVSSSKAQTRRRTQDCMSASCQHVTSQRLKRSLRGTSQLSPASAASRCQAKAQAQAQAAPGWTVPLTASGRPAALQAAAQVGSMAKGESMEGVADSPLALSRSAGNPAIESDIVIKPGSTESNCCVNEATLQPLLAM